MSKYEFSYEFFTDTNDGQVLSSYQRIEEAIKSLKNNDDYIELPDGTKCYNREDLDKAVKKHIKNRFVIDKNQFVKNE